MKHTRNTPEVPSETFIKHLLNSSENSQNTPETRPNSNLKTPPETQLKPPLQHPQKKPVIFFKLDRRRLIET